MPIQFTCPDCAEPFNVGDDLAGRTARCTCGLVITVPQPAVPIQPQPVDPLQGSLLPNPIASNPLMGSLPQGLPTANPLAGSVLTGVPSATQADEGNAGIPIVVKVGAGLGGVGVLGLLLWLGISFLGGGAETGPAVDVGTVEGTDFETGPAVDVETVVGTDFETGPAVDAETVVGTDSETGSDDVVKLETTPADPAAQPPLKQPQESITNTIGMHLKLIPAGTFMMGSPETVKGHRNDEHHHEVTVSKAFYMQTTEVTQGQWKAVMGTEPWKGEDNVKEGATYPATNMDWDESVAYCKKLSEKESKTYRLPTEAEWEYACRVGTKTTWSSGDDQTALGDYAWCDNNTLTIGEPYAHQVGLKKPNAFGLYDMHGNVFEWCHDLYDKNYYNQSPATDPLGPARGSFRVFRGGSWRDPLGVARSAFRAGMAAALREVNVGFRLVREIDDSSHSEQPTEPDLTVIELPSITNTLYMKFNKIPAGTFTMGSPLDETDREYGEHPHKVTISKAFYMQTTEVTQAQWKAVMLTDPWYGRNSKQGDNYPAASIKWTEAVVFCEKLSRKEGQTYRLPTEAEWEYACRAGAQTTWSFGNDEKELGDYAWYNKNVWDIGNRYAHQVGLKKPNAWGLYDTHGNILEWCYDYYVDDYYKHSPEKDPTGPTRGSPRVLRGGSWARDSGGTRSASHARFDPEGRVKDAGFRLVRELNSLEDDAGAKPVTKVLAESIAFIRELGGQLQLNRSNTAIARVNLNGTNITDAEMVYLKELTEISHLSLSNTKITDVGVKHLAELKNIKFLSLDATSITDLALEHLKAVRTLETLWLDETQITDDGLRHLVDLPKLTYFCVNSTRISDTGLVTLSEMTTLTHLEMNKTKITNIGMLSLAKLHRLERFWGAETDISDDGIKQIQNMTSMRELVLSKTKITDASIPYLKRMTGLEQINLGGTMISETGLKQIELRGKSAIPASELPASNGGPQNANQKKLNQERRYTLDQKDAYYVISLKDNGTYDVYVLGIDRFFVIDEFGNVPNPESRGTYRIDGEMIFISPAPNEVNVGKFVDGNIQVVDANNPIGKSLVGETFVYRPPEEFVVFARGLKGGTGNLIYALPTFGGRFMLAVAGGDPNRVENFTYLGLAKNDVTETLDESADNSIVQSAWLPDGTTEPELTARIRIGIKQLLKDIKDSGFDLESSFSKDFQQINNAEFEHTVVDKSGMTLVISFQNVFPTSFGLRAFAPPKMKGASGNSPLISPKLDAKAKSRTWTDSTGQFSIQATFVRISGDKVVLQGIDKKEISLPLAKLNAADQQYVKARLTSDSNAKRTITNTIGMTFNNIPAGTFMMGSPETEEGREDNETQHKVTVNKAFYMQTTEVTQGQWKALMGTEPWKDQELSKYVKEGANYPAVYVTWDDAVAYCKKLSEKEGKAYRLPTEAEWEYACRAGTTTNWSFGNDESDLGEYAWHGKNASDIGEKFAHQVGLKKPNAFGLHDMHGNVYEWCHDYYEEDYYKQSPEQDPTGPATGSHRVMRGGSWVDNTRRTRSAVRRWGVADRRYVSGGGFRLVRELDSLEDDAGAKPVTKILAESIAFINKLGGQFELNQSKTTIVRVSLANTRVTDAELVRLKGLTKVFQLVLADTQVTDAGLVHLDGLKDLRFLFLLNTQVTDAGVKKLQQALPNCKIIH